MNKKLKEIIGIGLVAIYTGFIGKLIVDPSAAQLKEFSVYEKGEICTDDIKSTVRIRREQNYEDGSIIDLLPMKTKLIIIEEFEKFSFVKVKEIDGKKVKIEGYVDNIYIKK